MTGTDKQLIENASDELGVLKGIIDYAERMIYDEGKRAEYGPLRRHAYGKSVLIETQRSGVLMFRLSSTSAVYPNAKSGYATPHSPVGRLCSFLRLGDEDETPRWGEYRVIEVRLFDRYDGPEFEANVRNFLSMKVDGYGARGQVLNLQASVARKAEIPDGSIRIQVEPSSIRDQELLSSEAVSSNQASSVTLLSTSIPSVVVETFSVIENEPVVGLELEEEEPGVEVISTRTEVYYGLSETFFVNRTREQDDVMSRSPIGPMFVHGVAGSGKTSAALGRTKMLCDFNVNSVVEESEFREIAGHTLAYWSGRYAGQFSQEGSVGFVRTGELIQYLKETCRRLDLPHLPVQEYPELRSRLRTHRRVDRSKPGRQRWAGQLQSRNGFEETTILWLRGADRAVARQIAEALKAALPTVELLTNRFVSGARDKAGRVAREAVNRLRMHIEELALNLVEQPVHGFLLDRLAMHVSACIDRVRQEVLGRDVIWLALGDRTWVCSNEQELARAIVTDKAALFSKAGVRLVFADLMGVTDDSLTLLARDGAVVAWSEETKLLLDKGELLVRDSAGRTLNAKSSSVSDVYLRLLPEAVDKLYVLTDNALRPLGVARGLGRERLELNEAVGAVQAEDGLVDEADATDDQQKRRSMDTVFAALARRLLLQPLTYLADSYSEALTKYPDFFPDPKLAQQIGQQLSLRKLADADLDLLLCLFHLVGRGFSGGQSSLTEPPFFQAVFIDEVQDFTEQQVYLMAEQARPEYRAVTAVGDIAQKLHNGNAIDVVACFPTERIPVVQLSENLRQMDAPGLAWFSTCFRGILIEHQQGIYPMGSLAVRLREQVDNLHGPELQWVNDDSEMMGQIVDALAKVQPHQTAAVLLPDADSAAACFALCKFELASRMIDSELSEKIDLSRRHIRHFTAISNSKGLEFDVVLVPRLEMYSLDQPIFVNRLYVALTRARRRLVILSDVSREISVFDDVWERYEAALCVG